MRNFIKNEPQIAISYLPPYKIPETPVVDEVIAATSGLMCGFTRVFR